MIRVGSLIRKKHGRIVPEEGGETGIVIAIDPGRAWTYITVSYPRGVQTCRASDVVVVEDELSDDQLEFVVGGMSHKRFKTWRAEFINGNE